MTGWGAGIERTLGNNYRSRGWGSPIDDDLKIGQSRYEFGVFLEDKLHKVFRTDDEKSTAFIETEARKYIERQEQEKPTSKYQLKQLQ